MIAPLACSVETARSSPVFMNAAGASVVAMTVTAGGAPGASTATENGGTVALAGTSAVAGATMGGAPTVATGGANAASAGSAGSPLTMGGMGGTGGTGTTAPFDAGMEPPPIPRSDGCGQPAMQAFGEYIRHTVSNSDRIYDLYIPDGYDPYNAYRLIVLGHGCDGSIPYPPLPDVSEGNALFVALRSESSQNSGQPYGGGCFDTGPGSSSLTELPYFDQVLEDVEAAYCIDESRVFMGGHSSGSWLTHLLGCARAGVIRGQGNSAGGLPVLPECTGPIAAMLVHDTDDDQNVFALGEEARDRILSINGCSADTVPYDYDGDPQTPSPCVEYQGCMPGYPVVWCPTMGKGHSDNIPITTVGYWRFWSGL